MQLMTNIHFPYSLCLFLSLCVCVFFVQSCILSNRIAIETRLLLGIWSVPRKCHDESQQFSNGH